MTPEEWRIKRQSLALERAQRAIRTQEARAHLESCAQSLDPNQKLKFLDWETAPLKHLQANLKNTTPAELADALANLEPEAIARIIHALFRKSEIVETY